MCAVILCKLCDRTLCRCRWRFALFKDLVSMTVASLFLWQSHLTSSTGCHRETAACHCSAAINLDISSCSWCALCFTRKNQRKPWTATWRSTWSRARRHGTPSPSVTQTPPTKRNTRWVVLETWKNYAQEHVLLFMERAVRVIWIRVRTWSKT